MLVFRPCIIEGGANRGTFGTYVSGGAIVGAPGVIGGNPHAPFFQSIRCVGASIVV